MPVLVSFRWLSATIVATCSIVLGCDKQANNAEAGSSGGAPVAQVQAAGAATFDAKNDAPAAIDPFQPTVGFDPDRLPASCESMVGVVLNVPGGTQEIRTGFVFDADDHLAYVAAGEIQAPIVVGTADDATPFSYQAIIGSGEHVRVVPLEVARRYPHSRGVVLSGPKRDLPQPLALRPQGDTPALGRRLHLIGFETPGELFGSKTGGVFARIAEPLEVIPFGKADFGVPIWFGLARPDSVRAVTGLVVADDGAIIGLAHETSPQGGRQAYDCFPTDSLRRFKEPELVFFSADRRAAGSNSAANPPAFGATTPPSILKAELRIRFQCIEYPRPLRHPRVLVSAKPMKIQPALPEQNTYTTTWLHPDSVRSPVHEIREGKWPGQSADVQVVELRSTPTTENLSLHTETISQTTAQTKLPVDKNLATYQATYAVARSQRGKIYMQCIFEDEQGVTKLLGPEQSVSVY